jgi:alpha-tubulin suppressor-like RCC1 family protein
MRTLWIVAVFAASVLPAEATGPRIAAGRYHALKINPDGTVWAWGLNTTGLLGGGGRSARTLPIQVPGLTSIVAVAASERHSLAVRQDGTVWAWGDNTYGQLGGIPIREVQSPIQVPGISTAKSVAAGEQFSLVLLSDGTVRLLGLRGTGAGIFTFFPQPDPVPGMSNITALAAGSQHALALRADGTVLAFGQNYFGQLGFGPTGEFAYDAVSVPGLSGVTAIAAYGEHSLALRADGTVWGWGSGGDWVGVADLFGQFLSPRQLPTISGATAIGAGQLHTVFTKADGSVWAVGGGPQGILGNGGTKVSLTPVQAVGPAHTVEVAASWFQTFALQSDGSLFAWGTNDFIGTGAPAYQPKPSLAAWLVGPTQIAAGAFHTLALLSTGNVLAAGSNYYGQLGAAAPDYLTIPGIVAGLNNVIQVAAGGHSSAALTRDGSVWTWGLNSMGQLGDGSQLDHPTPTRLTGLSGIASVSLGPSHSLALNSQGAVLAWGDNRYGKVTGNPNDSSVFPTPTPVAGLPPGIQSVAACSSHSLALDSSGTVWAWGSPTLDRFISPNPPFGPTDLAPVAIPGLSGIVKIACHLLRNVALKADGTLWTWGMASGEASGIPSGISSRAPGQITGTPAVVDIAAGGRQTLLLRPDGSLWSYGNDTCDSSIESATSSAPCRYPQPVPGLTGVQAITAGDNSAFAILSNGSVYSWGQTGAGGLANGAIDFQPTPVQVPVPLPPDLSIAIIPPANSRAGVNSLVKLEVTNNGGRPTAGTTTLTVALSAGLLLQSAAGADWNCISNAQTVTCSLPGVIGSSVTSAIELGLAVTSAASPTAQVSATVSNLSDPEANNNSAAVSFPVAPPQVGALPTTVILPSADGSTSRRTVTFIARDPDGVANLWYAQAQFASPKTEYNSCLIHYDAATNVFYLRNDDATEWWGIYPATNTRIGNSQCELYGATSYATKSGTDLTVILDISFRASFSGARDLYLLAADHDNNVSEWSRADSIGVTGDLTLLELLSVAPIAGAAPSQLFTMTLRDGDGAGKVWFSQLNINAANNAAQSCYVHFDPATQVYYLLSDNGLTWSGLHGGSDEQVQNSQCLLKGKNSTGTANGQDLTITYDLQFKPSVAGQKNVYARASDLDGNLVQWKRTGTFQVR